MKKYAILNLISFVLAVGGLIVMCLIYFGKLHSFVLLWISLAAIILSLVFIICCKVKTKNNKKKK